MIRMTRATAVAALILIVAAPAVGQRVPPAANQCAGEAPENVTVQIGGTGTDLDGTYVLQRRGSASYWSVAIGPRSGFENVSVVAYLRGPSPRPGPQFGELRVSIGAIGLPHFVLFQARRLEVPADCANLDVIAHPWRTLFRSDGTPIYHTAPGRFGASQWEREGTFARVRRQ